MPQDGKNQWLSHMVSIIRHPAFLIVAVAVVLRLILSPFLTYDFDMYHWGVIIENIQSGNGLYDVAGYYYTPVWGYIVGFFSVVQDALMNLDIFGIKFADALPIEDLLIRFHTAVITTPAFNVAMKLPMIICDVAVAVILFWLVKDRTRNEKKATVAVALWMLCPTIVYMSGVQGMFDSFSALMMLVTVILVYKGKYFLGGGMFAVATLLKFFPAFCIIVLVAYVYVKHRDDGLWKRNIMLAVLGAGLMSLIILLPQFLDGTIVDTLSFVIGRVEGTTDPFISMTNYLGMGFMVMSMLFFGYKMFKTREDADDAFFKYILLAFAVAMITSLTPQYMIVFMPFLILQLVSYEGKFNICWMLISAGSFINAFAMNNLSLLMSGSEYYGILTPEWIISGMELLQSTTLLGVDMVTLFSGIGGTIECIGIILIPVIFYRGWIAPRIPFVGALTSRIKGWYFE